MGMMDIIPLGADWFGKILAMKLAPPCPHCDETLWLLVKREPGKGIETSMRHGMFGEQTPWQLVTEAKRE